MERGKGSSGRTEVRHRTGEDKTVGKRDTGQVTGRS